MVLSSKRKVMLFICLLISITVIFDLRVKSVTGKVKLYRLLENKNIRNKLTHFFKFLRHAMSTEFIWNRHAYQRLIFLC